MKHWKRVGLSNKHFVDGYILNRKYFHATTEAISCMYFANIDANEEKVVLHVTEIDENGNCYFLKDIIVSKSHDVMSKLFDKRKNVR